MVLQIGAPESEKETQRYRSSSMQHGQSAVTEGKSVSWLREGSCRLCGLCVNSAL